MFWVLACTPEAPPADDPLNAERLSAAEVARAAEAGLPRLLAVEPVDLIGALSGVADRFEGEYCGVDAWDDDDGWTRFWYDDTCGEDRGVEGFSYERNGDYTSYPDDEVIGTLMYAFWGSHAWDGDIAAFGSGEWGDYDSVVDGYRLRVRWYQGELHVPAQFEPDWFVDGFGPNVAWQAAEDEAGETFTLRGNTPLEDRWGDALAVSDVAVSGGCASIEGFVSVHARDGAWFDLELDAAEGDAAVCRGCGEVTGPEGAIGRACLDVTPVLTGGTP